MQQAYPHMMDLFFSCCKRFKRQFTYGEKAIYTLWNYNVPKDVCVTRHIDIDLRYVILYMRVVLHIYSYDFLTRGVRCKPIRIGWRYGFLIVDVCGRLGQACLETLCSHRKCVSQVHLHW